MYEALNRLAWIGFKCWIEEHHKEKKPNVDAFFKGLKVLCDNTCEEEFKDTKIVIAESRDLQMRGVLSHPLGPFSWSLATADGFIRKTNKASLAKELHKQPFPNPQHV